MDTIRVSPTSGSTAVAGMIAGRMRESRYVELEAADAGAVNEAIKAVAIARGYLKLDGIDIVVVPSFVEVGIDERKRSSLRLVLEARSQSQLW